jgi:hypothetical protein
MRKQFSDLLYDPDQPFDTQLECYTNDTTTLTNCSTDFCYLNDETRHCSYSNDSTSMIISVKKNITNDQLVIGKNFTMVYHCYIPRCNSFDI